MHHLRRPSHVPHGMKTPEAATSGTETVRAMDSASKSYNGLPLYFSVGSLEAFAIAVVRLCSSTSCQVTPSSCHGRTARQYYTHESKVSDGFFGALVPAVGYPPPGR